MTINSKKWLAPSRVEGFSLIEMVVYIAILVFMLVIVVQVIFSIVHANRVIRAARNIENSALVSLERIGRELRKADTIDTATSVFSTHPGILSLDGKDDNGAPRSVDFSLSGGRLQLLLNGAPAGALSLASTTITRLIFTRFSAASTEGIRIEMSIESGTTTSYRTETFYSSVLLR